jgi:hypothetical protein
MVDRANLNNTRARTSLPQKRTPSSPKRRALLGAKRRDEGRRVSLLNSRFARAIWGPLPKPALRALKDLTERYALSITLGDLQFLDGRWYVTHAGLLRIAERRRCRGIRTVLQERFSDSIGNRWMFKAIVYTISGSKGFVGYGDADPSNVSPLVRGAEMRVAETRAVNRALRKAYGIGLCSIEELGWSSAPDPQTRKRPSSVGQRVSNNGQPRLRDRLCLLIRQYQLDPILVKRYAAEFCGTESLRDASRDLVESFINQLAEQAAKDRDGLLCHLNSYSRNEEVKS